MDQSKRVQLKVVGKSTKQYVVGVNGYQFLSTQGGQLCKPPCPSLWVHQSLISEQILRLGNGLF